MPHPLAAGAWPAHHPSFAAAGGRADARRVLEAYVPRDAEQRATRARMLAFLDEHPDALERTCGPGHFTAAAFLVDAAGERALLTLHAKLGRWLQLGGHCDGDGNLARAALREGREESGIDELSIHPVPVDLDVHPIPARPGKPEHLHLDVRFVAFAPPGAREVVGQESHDLAWFSPEQARALGSDPSVRRLFELAFPDRVRK